MRLALKSAQQLLRPGQRFVSNPDELDLAHAFVSQTTLRTLHNTFNQSMVCRCTSHMGLNNITIGGRAVCFYVGEDMAVLTPNRLLVDKSQFLNDPLFMSVAGESADRVIREPFVKPDTRAISQVLQQACCARVMIFCSSSSSREEICGWSWTALPCPTPCWIPKTR